MGENTQLQNRLIMLFRILPSSPSQNDAGFGLNMKLCTIFKICSPFSKFKAQQN